MMAIPSATVKITKACKITSMPLTFHRESPKSDVDNTTFEVLEIESKIAGKDSNTPIPSKAPAFRGEVFFVDLSVSISPERKRIAKVPTPTANWKIAA